MKIPPTIRESKHSSIYRAVYDAPIGKSLHFDGLTTRDVKSITMNVRNRAHRGTYGDGVKIRVRSLIDRSGLKELYITKYREETD